MTSLECVRALTQVVDHWTNTFYNDAMAEQRYNAFAQFPLAEPPADSNDQAPITEIQLDNAHW